MATDSILSFLFLVSCLAFFKSTVGLKCRVENDERTQEGFNDVVRACMNVNFRDEEMNKPHRNWQHRTQWGQGIPRFPTKGNRDGNQEDSDNQENSREMDYNQNGSQRGYHTRHRRGQPPKIFYSTRNNTSSSRNNNASPLEDIEPCVIHCIFRQMQMLDKNNQPDKSSVINVMTNKLRDPVLKDFIRDAISECFEMVESESQDTKCSFSKGFAMCLEQKGQQNCEDWDDEMKMSKQKQSSINNKHRG